MFARGNRVGVVAAERLVKRVRDIEALDVPITGDADVSGTNLVRQRQSGGRGANQKSVLIDEERGLVVIVQRAEIQRVALGEEITPIKVRGIDLLAPRAPSIQAAIGVLLQHVEVG